MCNNILNENKITFKDIESEIYKVVCDVACSAIKEVLQHLDRRLMNERDTKVLRNKGVKHTCIKTIMGNVEFDRRIYEFHTEDCKKAYKFLLDEHLQMESIGFMSVNLIEKMVSNVANLSYRKSAKNIEEMSNQSISHTAVWNVIQKLGVFYEGNVNDGLEYLTNLLIKYNADENRFKKFEDLYNYLVSNKDGLVPYKLREDVKLPTPPTGVEYRNLDTMEHNICDILAQRFKGRKMSWSENGASNLARILTELTNKNIYNFIASQYNKLVSKEVLSSFEELVVLTPEAVDRHIKKSKVYKTKRGKVPYDGYVTT